MISTEVYDELIEKYGAIESGEKPHRQIQVQKKTADDKKVSQTVRTILEAKATPDEAVPTINKIIYIKPKHRTVSCTVLWLYRSVIR